MHISKYITFKKVFIPEKHKIEIFLNVYTQL